MHGRTDRTASALNAGGVTPGWPVSVLAAATITRLRAMPVGPASRTGPPSFPSLDCAAGSLAISLAISSVA